jgi:3-isopropylmalate/(R)-2-methylmalate dehydratase large subunit
MGKNAKAANQHAKIRSIIKRLDLPHFFDVSTGICHQVLPESGLFSPGQLVVAPDSHTTLYGALNVAGTGIGETEAALILLTGELWFMVPPTIRIRVEGKLPPYISGKDVFLEVARQFGPEVAQYKAIEWCGPVIDEMSLDSRICISNQSVELGAKFSFFLGDKKTKDFYKLHGVEECNFVEPDKDAVYEEEYTINASDILSLVACPHSFSEVKPASELNEVEIQQAVIGGCANGRLEDLAIAAEILEGKRVAPSVKLIITPASQEVYVNALTKGYIEKMVRAGAIVTNSCCGPCIGNIGTLADGEICLTSTSRNFKGRMGNPKGIIYLSSPATAAASALTGKITDPRGYGNA